MRTRRSALSDPASNFCLARDYHGVRFGGVVRLGDIGRCGGWGRGLVMVCGSIMGLELAAQLPVRVRAGDPHLTDAVRDFLDGRGEVCIRSVASR